MVAKFGKNVRLADLVAVHENGSIDDFDHIAGDADHTLDVRLARVERKVKYDKITAGDGVGTKFVLVFVDEDALLVRETGHHAGAFHFHWLIDEDDQDNCENHRGANVAQEGNRVERGLVVSSWFGNGRLRAVWGEFFHLGWTIKRGVRIIEQLFCNIGRATRQNVS